MTNPMDLIHSALSALDNDIKIEPGSYLHDRFREVARSPAEPPATKTSNTSTIFTVEADWSEPPGNVEVVKYPDPPYQLLGDSGQIECPMCAGEGRVTPPSPNR